MASPQPNGADISAVAVGVSAVQGDPGVEDLQGRESAGANSSANIGGAGARTSSSSAHRLREKRLRSALEFQVEEPQEDLEAKTLTSAERMDADLDGDGVITARELKLFRMTVDASLKAAVGVARAQAMNSQVLAAAARPRASVTQRALLASSSLRSRARRSYAKRGYSRSYSSRAPYRRVFRRRF